MTPTLSLEANQLTDAEVEDILAELKPVTAAGAVVSGADGVDTANDKEASLSFPAASIALTTYEYEEDGDKALS